jgi:hypothetical protein
VARLQRRESAPRGPSARTCRLRVALDQVPCHLDGGVRTGRSCGSGAAPRRRPPRGRSGAPARRPGAGPDRSMRVVPTRPELCTVPVSAANGRRGRRASARPRWGHARRRHRIALAPALGTGPDRTSQSSGYRPEDLALLPDGVRVGLDEAPEEVSSIDSGLPLARKVQRQDPLADADAGAAVVGRAIRSWADPGWAFKRHRGPPRVQLARSRPRGWSGSHPSSSPCRTHAGMRGSPSSTGPRPRIRPPPPKARKSGFGHAIRRPRRPPLRGRIDGWIDGWMDGWTDAVGVARVVYAAAADPARLGSINDELELRQFTTEVQHPKR